MIKYHFQSGLIHKINKFHAEALYIPLRWPEAACAEEIPDGARGWQLRIARIKHHAEIFGDHRWLGAVLHLIKTHCTSTPLFATCVLGKWRAEALQRINSINNGRSLSPLNKQRGWCRSSPRTEWLCSVAESCAWSCPTLPQIGKKFCGVTSLKG